MSCAKRFSRFMPVLAMFAVIACAPSAARATITYTGDVTPTPVSSWSCSMFGGTKARIGNTSDGAIEVISDTLACESCYLGYSAGVSGSATVSGASTWSLPGGFMGGGIAVGFAGIGTLQIESGGTVTASWNARIGSGGVGMMEENTAGTGTVTVTGNGSLFKSNADLKIGTIGEGTLNILSGGSVSVARTTYLSSATTGFGHMNFDGGTLSTKSLNLCYADEPGALTGTGVITTRGFVGDGNLTFDGTAIGNMTFGTNIATTVTLDSPIGAGELGVGNVSNGTLLIKNGANVYSSDSTLGYNTSGHGAATVENATWNTTTLRVGYFGTGELLINSGGTVNTSGDTRIGGNVPVTSTGVVTVVGVWSASDIEIGTGGPGTLNIENGGYVSGSVLKVGFGTTVSDGTIDFNGGTLSATTLWSAAAGLEGSGTLNVRGIISDGDLVFDGTGVATKTFGTNIVTTVTADSPTGAGELGAGCSADGTLLIKNGANVYSTNGMIGYNDNGGAGTVTVDGGQQQAASWTIGNGNDGYLTVGHWGSGNLLITNGGTVAMADRGSGASIAALTGFVNGNPVGSFGTVTVDGEGSQWIWTDSSSSPSHTLAVGSVGTATMNITNGGVVSMPLGTSYIGSDDTSLGTVTVDGADSRWDAGTLCVGGYISSYGDDGHGSGVLNVTGGGAVVAKSISHGGTGTGTVYFDNGTLRAAESSTSFMTGLTSVYVKQNGVTIDTQAYDITIDQALLTDTVSTGGGLTKTGDGVLTLSGVNTYTGPTTINTGTLALVGVDTATPSAWDAVLTGGGADLQSGKLVFNYAGGTAPDIATILVASFGSSNPFSQGNGAQIYSTTADPNHGLGWLDDGVDEVTIMYTLYGDSNLDGSVNGTDLNAVLSYYNQSGEKWEHGDFNYDGSVNGTDLNTVLSNYNQSLSSSTAAVPEPSTLLLLVLGLAGLLVWRKRK